MQTYGKEIRFIYTANEKGANGVEEPQVVSSRVYYENGEQKTGKYVIMCSVERLRQEMNKIATCTIGNKINEFDMRTDTLLSEPTTFDQIRDFVTKYFYEFFEATNDTLMCRYYNGALILDALERITCGEFLYKHPRLMYNRAFLTDTQVTVIEPFMRMVLENEIASRMRKEVSEYIISEVNDLEKPLI